MSDGKEAIILEIQRMSTEDGPGLRTTLFFKGCPLACTWCHNPESIARAPQVQWVESKCIGCGQCVKVCPNRALTKTDHGIEIDRAVCGGCGTCVEECPSTAMELLGKRWALDELVAEVVKDRAFFETSGGGVTCSGGEATLQTPFVAAFLARLREAGIPTALDTCGLTSRENLEALLPHTDVLLFDLKLADDGAHRKFTGVGNERVLANLRFVAEYRRTHDTPSQMWIRTPIIPGATDNQENLRALGAIVARDLAGLVDRWELCSFNNLCRDKYLRLGRVWDFHEAELVTTETMDALAAAARAGGVDPAIVHVTGSTRLEQKPQTEDRPRPQVVKCCLVDGGSS